VKDDAVDALAGFRQLRALDLKDAGVSEAAVARLRAALPECQVLW
jgi:hypothetical protein